MPPHHRSTALRAPFADVATPDAYEEAPPQAAERAGPVPRRVAYLVNQYPAVSHTFIRREIAALEARGIAVERVALRTGGGLVDPADLAERDRTTHLLDDPAGLAAGVVRAVVRRPKGVLRALGYTLGRLGTTDRSAFVHLVYFAEACALGARAQAAGATHVHAHFGTNSAEVALLAARMFGLTFSFTVHGQEEFDKPAALDLAGKMREARFVVAVSAFGRAHLWRWCEPEERGKIALVRCGLDPAVLGRVPDAPGDPARLICVGRLSREKGQAVLLAAAARLVAAGRRFELVIVGDGPDRAALGDLVGLLGLAGTVRMTGTLPMEGVIAEIAAARALVLPSLAENLPIVAMEALALRRPVIASQVGGVPELVVAGQCGWLVPPSDDEALADAMAACLDASAATIARMGQAGRARVLAAHDASREAARLAALFP